MPTPVKPALCPHCDPNFDHSQPLDVPFACGACGDYVGRRGNYIVVAVFDHDMTPDEAAAKAESVLRLTDLIASRDDVDETVATIPWVDEAHWTSPR
jgi:hypothetical protein